MSTALDRFRTLQDAPAGEAWSTLLAECLRLARSATDPVALDRAVGELDLFLSDAGWDLWPAFEASVPRNADELAGWWDRQPAGRAVLLLDGLSLRELAPLLAGAEGHGFEATVAVHGSELPAETNEFAKALGFGQRSKLANDGAGAGHRLPGARTESTDAEWTACAGLIGSAPDVVLWHHWPDADVHRLDDAGAGLPKLAKHAADALAGDAFWSLVGRMAEGRRLVVTSDHGYAATASFAQAGTAETEHLRQRFKAGRFAPVPAAASGGGGGGGGAGRWLPPIDLDLDTRHGPHGFVNGRRKWKAAGGYPTLTHGGLSLLEVAVPFVELRRL